MRQIYTLILFIFSPFVLIRLFWLSRKNPAYRNRWFERFGILERLQSDSPVIWIHAVSVGEVNASKPLVNKLLDEYQHCQIVVTTVTPTGAVSVEKNHAGAIRHLYFPYDLPFIIEKFIHLVKPVILIIMETEIWPNLYKKCRDKNIPVLLVNARLSEKSSKGYNQIRSLTRATLDCLAVIAAQSNADADRFIGIGARSEIVKVTGNLKFDMEFLPSMMEEGQSLRRILSVNRPVWIAASTHAGEEGIILEANNIVLDEYNDALLILAPRHPERFNDVYELCKSKKLPVILRSEIENYSMQTQVIILDSLGEMSLFYSCSDVAFVGGSLIPAGGHNMLEPAGLGLPVITGVNTHNFSEITHMLKEDDALRIIHNSGELANNVINLFADANLRHHLGEKGKLIVSRHRGATDNIMTVIDSYL